MNPDGSAGTLADGRGAVLRVNAFAYPSPTYARFALLLAALATAGLFLGFWLHNEVVGGDYARSIQICKMLALGVPVNTPKGVSQFHDFKTCVGPVQLRKAAYGAAGAGVTLAGGLLVMAITPLVIARQQPAPGLLE